MERGGLVDIMFSWSLEDIEDEHLFKVQDIPTTFLSAGHYLGSFELPLLEESRAQLFSSLEMISEAPYAEVFSFSRARYVGESTFFHDVKVDHWRNRSNCHGKELYKTLPGDILVIADAKPETVSDLKRVGRTWSFALVSNVLYDYNENEAVVDNEDAITSNHFTVKVLKDLGKHEGMPESLFVIFLLNITTNNRIWKALRMQINLSIIKGVLHADSECRKCCNMCSTKSCEILNPKMEVDLKSKLNESQTEAVLASLVNIQCNHKSGIELIWGPPGTGKTKTVSMLLFELLKSKCRTVICAPSNIAVAELASRLLKLVVESHEVESAHDVLFHPLGDILLFGNKERLKISWEMEEIYLDYRVKRLKECLAPLTGWLHCFTSMIDLLEDCASEYVIYVENELIKEQEKEQKHSEENKEKDSNQDTQRSNSKPKSFLEFARERFLSTAPPLKRCVTILCTHIPESVIPKHVVQSMLSITGSLDSFEALLFHNGASSEVLKEIFSPPELIGPSSHHSPDFSLLLCSRRVECLFLLKSARESLKNINLPSARDTSLIQEFCFKNATLIFCTVSSSFKLHLMELEPLKVVVIDEATQLKECESTIALQLPGIKHAILVGDERQLPATVESKVSESAGFGRSLFQRLSSLDYPKRLLNVQYRMHPSISCFPNVMFYHNQVIDAASVRSRNYEKHYLPGPMFGPYSFINIFGGREERADVGHSRRNMVEVAVVMKLVQSLYKAWIGSNDILRIGIISPYAAQVGAIGDKLGKRYEEAQRFSVKVMSIDGFQGGEEDVIILSTVRSNQGGAIGFMNDPRRVNVALTRARHCLWILGNERTLINSSSVWEVLVRDAKERCCFFNADEDKVLGKTIVDVKKELDQLDDLLNGNSELFRNARWKVLFSEYFKKSFQRLPSVTTKASVLNFLLKLANGWRPKKRNINIASAISSHILRQYKVEGLYVICSTDIAREIIYTQVLKVWDVLPLEDVPSLVRRLDGIFVKYTNSFLNCCNERCLEGDLEVPRTWSTSFEIIRFRSPANDDKTNKSSSSGPVGGGYVENSKVSDSLLLMKFYSLSSRVANHMLTTSDGGELELPFEVTDEEWEIIMFERSTFILGRSGTGKTTVLTMKLFKKEQHYFLAVEGFGNVSENPQKNACETDSVNDDAEVAESNSRAANKNVLRQLFVTVSPKLCHAIKHHVLQLKSFASGGKYSSDSSSVEMVDIDGTAQLKEIPDTFIDLPARLFPVVISFEKFLIMLDRSVGNSFFNRFPEMRPLVHGEKGPGSIFVRSFIRTREVSYDKFCTVYWPHFNAKYIKNLDPSRVYTEIMTHIKGGLQAGASFDGKLSKQDYIELSEGRVSTLSKNDRDLIYELYLDYEKMKRENGDFDLADLVCDLHSRLKNGKYEGDMMDFVYIDEVQDLTMRQIALLKFVCRNVKEGFVFSGDTAQTIARGIDFRFEDIRSLFFCEFVQGTTIEGGRHDKGKISKTFHLSQNFRTHAGVLNLAQSVIDLICRFFPLSIDVLNRETSLIFGEAPILLESGNDEDAILTIFGNSVNRGSTFVGFGAHQVILVRDEAVKNEINSYVRKQALVLTILECKGLEFQDVLLYNFFGSSPLRKKWRVIYQYMKEQDLLDSSFSIPCFDIAKHSVLCSELKQLYVAITRTRQRLWVCENKEEFAEPMFEYWKKKGLVQVRKLDDSLAQAMQVASSPGEWKSQGYKLLQEGNYEMATVCFERAGDAYGEKLAKALGLKSTADRMHTSNPEMASIARKQAAEIFECIRKMESAAECFYILKEYERAGNLYLQCGEPYLENAGECFCLYGSYDRAAEVFFKANHFSKCLSACKQGKHFNLGLEFVQSRKQLASAENDPEKSSEINRCEDEFLESTAHYYHERNDKQSMMRYVKAFSSTVGMRVFLKTLRCYDELLFLEEELGNFLEAANIAKLKGDVLQEADLLGKAGQHKDASKLILRYALSNSLWSSGRKGWPLMPFIREDEILNKAKSFAQNVLNEWHEFVLAEAEVLRSGQNSLALLKKQLEESMNRSSIQGEVLTSRKILDSHFQVDASKYTWEDDLVVNLAQLSSEKLSKHHVSGETLMFFWNSWKENVVNVLEYLGHVESDDVKGYKGHGDFCLNYLGIRREFQNCNALYFLMIPDVVWVREQLDDRVLRRTGMLTYLGVQQFVSSARSYWSSQLVSVGTKVLSILEALYKFSVKYSLPLFCQARSLTFIYEAAKFLLYSKYINRQSSENKKLQRSVELATGNFFECIFRLDWTEPVKQNLISLRRSKMCVDLLNHIVSEYAGSNKRVSYGQLGRMALILLSSGKPNEELCAQIANHLNCSSPWKVLMEHLCRSPRVESLLHYDENGVPCEISLKRMLHEALEDAYNANWKTELDYISPGCFLYLVEFELILASYFQGYFVTTKLSFVEWLLYQDGNGRRTIMPGGQESKSMEAFVPFMLNTVHQLLSNEQDTKYWTRGACSSTGNSYALTLFRLVVILCLLHLNFKCGGSLLCELLLNKRICQRLPSRFEDALRRAVSCTSYNAVLDKLAEGFRSIGNPLVIASLGGDCSQFHHPKIILVEMVSNQSTEEVLNILNPKINKVPQPEKRTFSSARASETSQDGSKHEKLTSQDIISATDVSHRQLSALFEALGLFNSGEKRNLVANDKLVLEKAIHCISAAVDEHLQQNQSDGENKLLLEDAANTIKELEQLHSLLVKREPKVGNDDPTIGELLMKLQSRRPRMETFLNMLLSRETKTPEAIESSIQHNAESKDDNGNSEANQESCSSEKQPENSSHALSSSGSQDIGSETKKKGIAKSKRRKSKRGKKK